MHDGDRQLRELRNCTIGPTACTGRALESFYEHSRGNIASALATLVSSPGVEINEAAVHLDALDRYRKTKVHFVDCMIAATASAEKISRRDLRPRLPKVRRRARRNPIVFSSRLAGVERLKPASSEGPINRHLR